MMVDWTLLGILGKKVHIEFHPKDKVEVKIKEGEPSLFFPGRFDGYQFLDKTYLDVGNEIGVYNTLLLESKLNRGIISDEPQGGGSSLEDILESIEKRLDRLERNAV